MTTYLCDVELVCDRCAKDVTDDDVCIGGESDSPSHCAYCHRPLFDDFGLTGEGVRYVVERVRETLKSGKASKPGEWRWTHGYYIGCDSNTVLRDWVELISDGHYIRAHDRRAERILSWFMYLSDPDRQKAA